MSVEQKFEPVELAEAVRDLLVGKAVEAGLEINAIIVGTPREAIPEAEYFPLVVVELEGGDNRLVAAQRYEQSYRFRVHYIARNESGRNNAFFVWQGARRMADILESEPKLSGAVCLGQVNDLRCNEPTAYAVPEAGGHVTGASVGYRCWRKVLC